MKRKEQTDIGMPFRVRACTCVEVFKCACVHANCVCAATTFVGCGTTSEKRNLTIAWSALFGLPQPKWCLEKSGTTIPCFNPGDQASSTLFCHTPRSRSSAKFFSILQALSIFCNSRITLSAPGPSGRQHNWLMDAPQSGWSFKSSCLSAPKQTNTCKQGNHWPIVWVWTKSKTLLEACQSRSAVITSSHTRCNAWRLWNWQEILTSFNFLGSASTNESKVFWEIITSFPHIALIEGPARPCLTSNWLIWRDSSILLRCGWGCFKLALEVQGHILRTSGKNIWRDQCLSMPIIGDCVQFLWPVVFAKQNNTCKTRRNSMN